MSISHAKATAGVYPGVGKEGADKFIAWCDWLGRDLGFITGNCGTGTVEKPFSEARANTRMFFELEDGWRAKLPNPIFCLTVPLASGGNRLQPAARKTLLTQVADGKWDDDLLLIANRCAQGGPTIVRLGSESDILHNPYSLRDGCHPEWNKAFNHVALLFNRADVPCIDITGNGNWPIYWDLATPRPEVYTTFGCDIYFGNPTPGKFGSAQEVLDRTRAVQQEAADRGKLVSYPEWGVWGDRGITDRDATQFVEDLFEVMSGFPERGPGALLYWSLFEGFKPTSLDHFPQAKRKYKELVG